MAPLRLAIVDDARFVREALVRVLGTDPRLQIVGVAGTGEELLARFDAWRPDVVTLDLEMPGQGGLATLDALMARQRIPVVILSTHSGEGAPATLEALSRGAADFVDKEAVSLVDFRAVREVLIAKLLQVTGRFEPRDGAPLPAAAAAAAPAPASGTVELIAIGASTGGPKAVETVLQGLGGAPRSAIAVVQHMPEGFTAAFADRLRRTVGFPVAEARDGEMVTVGEARIAPAGRHLTVLRGRDGLLLRVDVEPSGTPHRPSVDVLFRSVARAVGAHAVGVLLTGMGSDGAAGMADLLNAGAHTIAQDEATSVVFGMPRAAIVAGAAREILPLGAVGGRLRQLEDGNESAAACAAGDATAHAD
jgi:two-component system, chemotaxis family, protein-glutamate methylesterase/glutaminase